MLNTLKHYSEKKIINVTSRLATFQANMSEDNYELLHSVFTTGLIIASTYCVEKKGKHTTTNHKN